MVLIYSLFYARFLRITMVSRPTTMIAMNRPATAGMKYRSAAVGAGVAVGVGVAAAWSTVKLVSADEP